MQRKSFLKSISLGTLGLMAGSTFVFNACDDVDEGLNDDYPYKKFNKESERFFIIKSYRFSSDEKIMRMFSCDKVIELDVIAICQKLSGRSLFETMKEYGVRDRSTANFQYFYDVQARHFNFYDMKLVNRILKFPVFNKGRTMRNVPELVKSPIAMTLSEARKYFRQPLLDKVLLK